MSLAKEGSPSSPRKIIVNGQEIILDKRPPLKLTGEPKNPSGYECGPGVHLEGQTVVQDGNDWKSIEGLSSGSGVYVSSVDEPEVRQVISHLLSPSELRPI